MNSDFGEVLLRFSRRGLSGCFIVESSDRKGIIYLIEGLVVHAMVNELSGLPAFLQFFTWESPDRFEWTRDMGAKEQTMALSYEAIVVMITYAEVNTTPDEALRDAEVERLENLTQETIPLALEIETDNSTVTFPIRTKQIRVGRTDMNDLILDDTSVSRHHAFMTIFQDGLVVHDIGSTNGTHVDGEQVFLCKVDINQPIVFGSVSCKLVKDEARSTPPKKVSRTRMTEKTTKIPIVAKADVAS